MKAIRGTNWVSSQVHAHWNKLERCSLEHWEMARVVVTQLYERTTCVWLVANATVLLWSPKKSGYDGSFFFWCCLSDTLLMRSNTDSFDELHFKRQSDHVSSSRVEERVAFCTRGDWWSDTCAPMLILSHIDISASHNCAQNTHSIASFHHSAHSIRLVASVQRLYRTQSKRNILLHMCFNLDKITSWIRRPVEILMQDPTLQKANTTKPQNIMSEKHRKIASCVYRWENLRRSP